jgi:hypothetical protein
MTYSDLFEMLTNSQLDSYITVENQKGGVDLVDAVFLPEGGVVLAVDGFRTTYQNLNLSMNESQLDCDVEFRTPNGRVVPVDVVFTPEGGVVLAID